MLIAISVPMNRELKEGSRGRVQDHQGQVAVPIPMNRELKGHLLHSAGVDGVKLQCPSRRIGS